MVFADFSVGLDTLAGGGVTGMLVIVMTAFLRRTKDTDDRRDEASKMVMDAAMEREARAWKERDNALLERDIAREETQGVRDQFERARQSWQEERDSWRTQSRE